MLDIIKKTIAIEDLQELKKLVKYISWNGVYLSDPKILKKALEYREYLDIDFVKIIEERLSDKRSLEEVKKSLKYYLKKFWEKKNRVCIYKLYFNILILKGYS